MKNFNSLVLYISIVVVIYVLYIPIFTSCTTPQIVRVASGNAVMVYRGGTFKLDKVGNNIMSKRK